MMVAGEYYIGDLCYVIEEWDDFCSVILDGDNVHDGEMTMPDGRKFASYGTAHGDGVYEDQFGHEYCVDAGLIGCILVSDITRKDYDDLTRLGRIKVFDRDFITGSERGVITFGNIRIDTDPEYDEYEEEYEEPDYDEEEY
jgi:hypothetical protein